MEPIGGQIDFHHVIYADVLFEYLNLANIHGLVNEIVDLHENEMGIGQSAGPALHTVAPFRRGIRFTVIGTSPAGSPFDNVVAEVGRMAEGFQREIGRELAIRLRVAEYRHRLLRGPESVEEIGKTREDRIVPIGRGYINTHRIAAPFRPRVGRASWAPADSLVGVWFLQSARPASPPRTGAAAPLY